MYKTSIELAFTITQHLWATRINSVLNGDNL